MTVIGCIDSMKKKLTLSGLTQEAEYLPGEILTAAMGWNPLDWQVRKEQKLSVDQIKEIDQIFLRRKEGEPLAHIVGEKDFFGLKFFVSPDVLIPRDETEILVERAIETIGDRKCNVADLGSGSGCIGISIAKRCQNARVSFYEICDSAMEIIKKNGKRNKVIQRSEFFLGSIPKDFNSLEEFDLVVANPPYISVTDPFVSETVKRWEPSKALFADNDGLECIQLWLEWGLKALKNDGTLIMEHGWQQGEQVVDCAKKIGFREIVSISDYSGHQRFVMGRK